MPKNAFLTRLHTISNTPIFYNYCIVMNNNIFPLICFVITLMQNLNIMNVFLCMYCVLKKKKNGGSFFSCVVTSTNVGIEISRKRNSGCLLVKWLY